MFSFKSILIIYLDEIWFCVTKINIASSVEHPFIDYPNFFSAIWVFFGGCGCRLLGFFFLIQLEKLLNGNIFSPMLAMSPQKETSRVSEVFELRNISSKVKELQYTKYLWTNEGKRSNGTMVESKAKKLNCLNSQKYCKVNVHRLAKH